MKINTYACYACAISLMIFYAVTRDASAGAIGIAIGWAPAIFPSTDPIKAK